LDCFSSNFCEIIAVYGRCDLAEFFVEHAKRLLGGRKVAIPTLRSVSFPLDFKDHRSNF
jgi:hypothetical protein